MSPLNTSLLVGRTGFIPGLTQPYYQITQNLNGAKNIGNLPGVSRSEYGSTVTDGVTQLSGTLYENLDFTDTVLDLRNSMTLNNCRLFLSDGYIAADTIRAGIRILNGTAGAVVMNDCEIHIRIQRTMTALTGRNLIMNRCVITGGVDGPSVADTGAAPLNSGIEMNDCWVGGLQWWRTGATPWEGHPSDTQTHNDSSQVATTLGCRWFNTVLNATASPYAGTGTPGSSFLDGGNPYNANYTNVAQATLESWRATYLDYSSTPAQSYLEQTYRMSSAGSWACIMGNRNGGEVEQCYFSGGTVCINLMDTNVTGDWSIKRSVFWNDMINGHSGNPATKGHAVLARAGLSGILDMPTTGADRNLWFDGGTVSPVFL
jgi:hypothetical protein